MTAGRTRILTALMAVLPVGAHAGTVVLYDNTISVQGGQALAVELSLPSAGSLSVVTDEIPLSGVTLGPPELQLESDGELLTPLVSGSLLYQAAAPEIVSANVYTAAQAGSTGLYNLTATFTATSTVPLPASGLLLLTTVLALPFSGSLLGHRALTTVTSAVA